MLNIEDLSNSKIYRTLKVLFVFSSLIVISYFLYNYYDESVIYLTNNEKTRITCQNGIVKEFYKNDLNIKPDEKEIDLIRKKEISLKVCNINVDLIYETPSEYTFLSHNNVFIASEGLMEQSHDYKFLVVRVLILIIISLLITEILRRSIYYITLGAIFPKV